MEWIYYANSYTLSNFLLHKVRKIVLYLCIWLSSSLCNYYLQCMWYTFMFACNSVYLCTYSQLNLALWHSDDESLWFSCVAITTCMAYLGSFIYLFYYFSVTEPLQIPSISTKVTAFCLPYCLQYVHSICLPTSCLNSKLLSMFHPVWI